MSASVVDAVTIERRGMPAVAIGIEKLVNTTGRGMARAQGVPDYPIAIVGHDLGIIEDLKNDEEVEAIAKSLVDQVETMLLGKK
ncbi:MAG: hypothetical protein JRG73_08135 [Deltaproteobacteria bacterium]|nr:hypothetical protein [Deltaproteobacteria bacterium]MBW2306889.1 hypothetical protein [Deltaproteobacteria bacterium]